MCSLSVAFSLFNMERKEKEETKTQKEEEEEKTETATLIKELVLSVWKMEEQPSQKTPLSITLGSIYLFVF